LLLQTIEEAEQIGEPDIAEIVREALGEIRATIWKTTRRRNSPCMIRKWPLVSLFPMAEGGAESLSLA
jgi:hypothetical protein